jgi:hypothetical protein
LRASENDFEGIQTTIPWVRDAKGQVDDWGVFVRVHTGRGQDTCISEHAQDADGQWSRLCEDGGARKRRGARAGRRRTVESTV